MKVTYEMECDPFSIVVDRWCVGGDVVLFGMSHCDSSCDNSLNKTTFFAFSVSGASGLPPSSNVSTTKVQRRRAIDR